MENWEAWLLIALILGVIVSNIMVLKHTANMKVPPFINKKGKLVKKTGDNERSEGDEKDKS